jgi:hypothetical protein
VTGSERLCGKCELPLREGQDWCLHCGSGVPGSLGGGPGWRTGAAILGVTAVLVAGASVAAYAALEKSKPKHVVVVASTTPAPGATTPGAPGTTPAPGTPTTVKAAPPKIPLQTATPKSTKSEANEALFPPETTKGSKTTKTSTPTKTTSESPSENSAGEEGSEKQSGSRGEKPSPILLDTNAASTYNPYTYSPSLFGDPSLAIDGEVKTAWTAQVQPTVAPKMAEGLVLDLKNPQKLGSVTIKTTTTGITAEVYGANGTTLPASIADPAWTRLVGLKVLKKKSNPFTLKRKDKGFRFILLWLAKGPPNSTAATPGSVSINEFELFPVAK